MTSKSLRFRFQTPGEAVEFFDTIRGVPIARAGCAVLIVTVDPNLRKQIRQTAETLGGREL